MGIDGDGTDGVGHDMTRGGVFDVLDMATDVRLDGRVLEDTVARLVEGAVFEHEVVGIAQQLLARHGRKTCRRCSFRARGCRYSTAAVRPSGDSSPSVHS